MTDIARGELRSYKQLPQIWYQIQTKFRDEPRPKSGLLRVRQFIMKDSYSFDLDQPGLDESYEKHYQAYCRIFARCGIKYTVVEAHSGSMGGSQSQEFMVASDAGEDLVASCDKCGYSANLERAVSVPIPPVSSDPEGDFSPEEFNTPGRKTIARWLSLLACRRLLKLRVLLWQPMTSLYWHCSEATILLAKPSLKASLGVRSSGLPTRKRCVNGLAPMPALIRPVGMNKIRIIADEALKGRRNMICGANKDDYHLRNVTIGKDFQAEFHDLREVVEGDKCASCGDGIQSARP